MRIKTAALPFGKRQRDTRSLIKTLLTFPISLLPVMTRSALSGYINTLSFSTRKRMLPISRKWLLSLRLPGRIICCAKPTAIPCGRYLITLGLQTKRKIINRPGSEGRATREIRRLQGSRR